MERQNPDDAELERFNYKPELRRRLGLLGSIALAYSSISITMGIFSNYGYVLTTSGPAGLWTWVFVALGQTLVALIFAELAGRIPLSGYSYQWVGRLAGKGIGWFTGWIALCNMIINVPAVNGVCAPIIIDLLGLKNDAMTQAIIVIAITTAQFLINSFQIRLAARLNNLAAFTEIAGIFGLIVLLFSAVAIHGQAHPEMLFKRAEGLAGSYWPHFLLATLLGSWALVAFENAADMAEETVNPRRTVPRAILTSLLVSASIGFLALIALTLAIPNLDAITKADSPITAILEYHWGRTVTVIFMATVTVSIISCGVIVMAVASRLIYAMARDGAFPAPAFFRHVSAGNAIPWRAVGLVYIVSVALALAADQLTSLFAASSILFAVIYLITIIAYALKLKSLPPVESFSLRKGRGVIVGLAILWLVAELCILTIPEQFHAGALAAGAVGFSGLVLYVVWFRRKPKA